MTRRTIALLLTALALPGCAERAPTRSSRPADDLIDQARHACERGDLAAASALTERVEEADPAGFAAESLRRFIDAAPRPATGGEAGVVEHRDPWRPYFEIYDVSDLLYTITTRRETTDAGTAELQRAGLIQRAREATGGAACWGDGTSIEAHRGQLLVTNVPAVHERLAEFLVLERQRRAIFDAIMGSAQPAR